MSISNTLYEGKRFRTFSHQYSIHLGSYLVYHTFYIGSDKSVNKHTKKNMPFSPRVGFSISCCFHWLKVTLSQVFQIVCGNLWDKANLLECLYSAEIQREALASFLKKNGPMTLTAWNPNQAANETGSVFSSAAVHHSIFYNFVCQQNLIVFSGNCDFRAVCLKTHQLTDDISDGHRAWVIVPTELNMPP